MQIQIERREFSDHGTSSPSLTLSIYVNIQMYFKFSSELILDIFLRVQDETFHVLEVDVLTNMLKKNICNLFTKRKFLLSACKSQIYTNTSSRHTMGIQK